MAGQSSKLKILYLMKIFMEKTDEEHYITMSDIMYELEGYDIECERKSIYRDIDALIEYGLDIEKVQKDKTCYYYLSTREFELAEVKLLVDAVQSERFITQRKSNALIKKIMGLTSSENASALQRQVYVNNRIKTDNESVLYLTDTIYNAISSNKQISFKYFRYDVEKKKEIRNNGEPYVVSPWAVSFVEDNYYLVAYSNELGIRHFRVDKMLNCNILDASREGKEIFAKFDVADYTKKRFKMFDGVVRSVSLKCKNSFANVIVDTFGKDTMMVPDGDGYFTAHVDVAISHQFIGWVFSMDDNIVITGPEEVVNEAAAMVKALGKLYKKK